MCKLSENVDENGPRVIACLLGEEMDEVQEMIFLPPPKKKHNQASQTDSVFSLVETAHGATGCWSLTLMALFDSCDSRWITSSKDAHIFGSGWFVTVKDPLASLAKMWCSAVCAETCRDSVYCPACARVRTRKVPALAPALYSSCSAVRRSICPCSQFAVDCDQCAGAFLLPCGRGGGATLGISSYRSSGMGRACLDWGVVLGTGGRASR